MDLATLNGRPTRFLEFQGKKYGLAPLTLRQFGEVQSVMASLFSDPLAGVADILPLVNAEQGRVMIAEAMKLRSSPRGTIGTDEGNAVMTNVKVVEEITYQSLLGATPSVTRELVAQMLDHFSPGELIPTVYGAAGMDRIDDPKAPKSSPPSIAT